MRTDDKAENAYQRAIYNSLPARVRSRIGRAAYRAAREAGESVARARMRYSSAIRSAAFARRRTRRDR